MEVEMKIRGLMMDPVTSMPIVVLKDVQGQAVLPIWVGVYEANAIALEIEKVQTPRPMTHDLLKNFLLGLEVRVQKIVLNAQHERAAVMAREQPVEQRRARTADVQEARGAGREPHANRRVHRTRRQRGITLPVGRYLGRRPRPLQDVGPSFPARATLTAPAAIALPSATKRRAALCQLRSVPGLGRPTIQTHPTRARNIAKRPRVVQ